MRRATAMGCSGGGWEDCSRLCSLIARSVPPYALALISQRSSPDPSSSSAKESAGHSLPLTKEAEKDLLISLSLVIRREIQRWTIEMDCDSEQEDHVKMEDEGQGKEKLGVNVVNPISYNYCSWHLEAPFESHCCLANIVCLLTAFLTVESRYIQHLAGNILMVISNFLAKSGRKCEEFLRLLWISLEVAIYSCTLLSASDKSIILAEENLVFQYPSVKDETSATTEDSYRYIAHLITLLRPRVMNSNWPMLSDLVRVLRNILKSLKYEHGDLAELCMHFAVSSLLKVPWDLLSEIRVAQTGEKRMNSSWDDLPDRKHGSLELNDVFLGALLQLFCSLVEQNVLENGGSPLDELSIYSKFTNLVPKLLLCCFSCHLGYNHMCMSQYLRHKALVLMIRLSFWGHWQCSALVSWLQLLRKYFEDLLYQPISKCHAGHDISLEGSPFLSSITDGGKVDNSCTTHLQRQAVFLFVKCCFTLIRLNNEPCPECTCGTATSSFTSGLQTCRKICCNRGLSELSEWLQRHASLEKFVDDVNYLKSCNRFALFFMQFYMDEDDLLFEMLLQLLDDPFPTMLVQNSNNDKLCVEMDKDIIFHISNIFNPIHLFHLFLALLHYDHLVLLDYLISNDTGIQCVQYLLRCLRIVCKSWLIFVEFPVSQSEIGQLYSMNGQDPNGKLELSSPSTIEISSRVPVSGSKRRRKFGSMRKCTPQAFLDAKACLLSLKTSVEDLHRKNLFPYNPTALLRSFARFQELCEQQ